MDKDRDFKIKLIRPCMFEGKDMPYKYLPFGMSVIAAFLRKHNHYVEQEDLSIKLNWYRDYFFPTLNLKGKIYIPEYRSQMRRMLRTGNFNCGLGSIIDSLLDSIRLDGFDLIGFSVFSYPHFLFALLLSRRIKQTTNAPIVFGGPFITLFGHLYPEIFNYADYMITGDGGVPMLKLIDYLQNKIPISEVPNLTYKKDRKIQTNPKEHYPLEEIPAPDFNGLPLHLYKNYNLRGNTWLPYQITRGCTNRCSFCIYTRVEEKLEFKSYEKVISELKEMKKKYHSRIFHFCDTTINNSYEYLEGLCDVFIENKLDICWAVFARVGNLDRHILGKMHKAGCWLLDFGIESGSDKVLKMMNKGFSAAQASQTLKESAEAGIQNTTCLITGFPHETNQDIKKTVDFIRRNKKYICCGLQYNFSLVPGSPIYLNPEKYGVTKMTQLMPHLFAFDESSGLTWEKKQKQQMYSRKKINKAIERYINRRNFVINAPNLFRLAIFKMKRLHPKALMSKVWNLSSPRLKEIETYFYFCRHRLLKFSYTKINFDHFLNKSQWWPRKRLEQYQIIKLRQLLIYVYKNVPYYTEIFKKFGLKPAEIRSLADLRKLPILTKEDIVENFDKLISREIAKEHLKLVTASGATGKPLQLYRDIRYNVIDSAFLKRSYERINISIQDKHIHLWSRPFLEKKIKVIYLYGPKKRKLSLSAVPQSNNLREKYLKLIREFNPLFVQGNPSMLYRLAYYAQKNRINDIRFKYFISYYENIFPFQIEQIEKQFGCEVFDRYSCVEHVISAMECPEHTGLHIDMERGILEIVGEDGQVLPEGEQGRIIATGLYNYAMPLIRYDLGDTGSISTKPCPCGRGLLLLKSLNGRANAVLRYNNKVVYSTTLSVILWQFKNIKECQFVQEDEDELKINIVKRTDYSENDTQELIKTLQQMIDEKLNINITFLDHIPRTNMGKFPFVISKLKPHG